MFRKAISITLLVSLLAIGTSGLLMFFISKTSFTLQMHPVHKIFGLIFVFAAIFHVKFNFKAITNHLKKRIPALTGAVLVVILISLYAVALNRRVPENMATELNNLADQAEKQLEGD